MALVELQNRGILKYVVSQNCDGLHRRSSILLVSSELNHSGVQLSVDFFPPGSNLGTSWEQ